METTKNITVIPARRRVGNTAKETEIPKLRVAAYCRVSTDSDEQARALHGLHSQESGMGVCRNIR